ncbi:hypothetical protein LXL04_033435 [Taraxacum kok-saghyz]
MGKSDQSNNDKQGILFFERMTILEEKLLHHVSPTFQKFGASLRSGTLSVEYLFIAKKRNMKFGLARTFGVEDVKKYEEKLNDG